MTESQLQEQVAQYLRLQYPDVIFHSDFGSGVKLTPAQAARQKRQNGGKRAWPDIFIAEPVCEDENGNQLRWLKNGSIPEAHDKASVYSICTGLFIELKREDTRLFKKNGEPASEHIKEQLVMLRRLEKRGYVAEFAVGFDEAKKIIDEYLGGK